MLGYSSLDAYLADKKTYFGAIVGRYGNRIALGKFSINGHQYQVPMNNNANSLHGGTMGFDKLVWQGRAIADGVEMTLVSKDGDQGYPRNADGACAVYGASQCAAHRLLGFDG